MQLRYRKARVVTEYQNRNEIQQELLVHEISFHTLEESGEDQAALRMVY
jgi:hypothetical protein